MGIRQTLQKQQGLFTALAIIVILGAGYMVFQTVRGTPKPVRPTSAFFTTDDGKTWFADDIAKVPPFKAADGKEAVAAVVASCSGGSQPFVLYLWKYTEAGKQEVEAGKTNPETEYKKEVKKPGQPTWIKTSDMMRATTIQNIECPPGGGDEYMELKP